MVTQVTKTIWKKENISGLGNRPNQGSVISLLPVTYKIVSWYLIFEYNTVRTQQIGLSEYQTYINS